MLKDLQKLSNFRDTSFKDFRWIADETLRPLDETIDFFIEDIALITLQSQFILRPNKENGQYFRPIQPICLLTETIETKDDDILKILQSKIWFDALIDFTIAGMFVYTRTLHNSDWTTNDAVLCKFRVEQELCDILVISTSLSSLRF